MIYDQMKNLESLTALQPEALSAIAAFLKTITPDSEIGRFELLDNKRVYAMIQEYETHPLIPEKLEIHHNYADIQLLIKGNEVIGYESVDDRPVAREYNPEKDCAMFAADPGRVVNLPLYPGVFSLFLPMEGHLPGLGDGSVARKVVIKIHKSMIR